MYDTRSVDAFVPDYRDSSTPGQRYRRRSIDGVNVDVDLFVDEQMFGRICRTRVTNVCDRLLTNMILKFLYTCPRVPLWHDLCFPQRCFFQWRLYLRNRNAYTVCCRVGRVQDTCRSCRRDLWLTAKTTFVGASIEQTKAAHTLHLFLTARERQLCACRCCFAYRTFITITVRS